MIMKRRILYFVLFFISSFFLNGNAQEKTVQIKIIQTSDVHGSFFPYDFITRKSTNGSLARVHAYVEEERKRNPNVLLIDNGDILQGQPSAYYYNYVDTVSTHLASEIMNYMGYSVGNVGNHDVETSRRVMDRWINDCTFPVLGANMIETENNQTHLKPYVMFDFEGVKVAVLGMITPAIPIWLAESLWNGLRFDDMEQTARKWMPVIMEKEKPDLVIGVFHAGSNARILGGKYNEDASEEIAKNIPGFDIVLMGHDHRLTCHKVVNIQGDSVLVLNPANRANHVADVDVSLQLDGDKVVKKSVSGKLVSMSKVEVSQDYMNHFKPRFDLVSNFVSKKIGSISETISTRDAYFGPSAFVDLIHTLQLELTGAQVSLTAPLSFDAQILKGDIYVSDLFNLYKYENSLYTMNLTGKEILGALEMSYDNWTSQMTSSKDHMLLLSGNNQNGKLNFLNPSFNFDSAAGIIYTVDLTKPNGQKVHIEKMANGESFDPDKMYTVAVNSYRGNGGGELLTKGAGIPQDQLRERIVRSTDKDLRYYLMRYIEQHGAIDPKPLNQWKFIPKRWAAKAAERDYQVLFGKKE